MVNGTSVEPPRGLSRFSITCIRIFRVSDPITGVVSLWKEIKMRLYIVNLTNYLIGKHGFDLMFGNMKARAKSAPRWKQEFVSWVHVTISSKDVREMSPETLGKVMCSFEGCELLGIRPASFLGEPGECLRDLVSLFLAQSIRYRLDNDVRRHLPDVPPYPKAPKKTEADCNPLSGRCGP